VGVTGVMGVEGVASVAFVLLESRLPFMVGSESRGRISNGGVEGTSFFFPFSPSFFLARKIIEGELGSFSNMGNEHMLSDHPFFLLILEP